ncbi:MAG: stage II sporulation protein M [Candidatus ainarchaeum sp.]|nr:stage II sporulation protein M [Candidatus ainarchaeum sp.]
MVLEHIFKTKDLLHSHFKLILYTAIITVIACFTSYFFFPDSASILTIAFISIAFTYLMYSTFQMLEKQETGDYKFNLWKKYSFVFMAYAKIFLVITFVFSVIFILVPDDIRMTLFSDQMKTLQNISTVKDVVNAKFAYFTQKGEAFFSLIFVNNLQVLLAIILLSFVYGAGAVFLIAYQASILGVIIGSNVLNLVNKYLHFGVAAKAMAFAHATYLSLGILPHGIFEIFAYFVGAVAGGIISAMLVGHYYKDVKTVRNTIVDVIILIILAVVCLLIGALIESYLLI